LAAAGAKGGLRENTPAAANARPALRRGSQKRKPARAAKNKREKGRSRIKN